MNSDVVSRILVEVATGREPSVSDDDEMAAMRKQLQRECDQIRADGFDIDVPFEIPDVSTENPEAE